MPSAEFDGSPLPLLPFGSCFHEWFKYHDNDPNIESGDFFANLVRVYPTGPYTVQGIVQAHKTLCNEGALLLERIDRGEVENPWHHTQKYGFKPTYRAIIMVMDQYVHAREEGEPRELISIEEHSKNQTVLLRTGDESHLSAPINFEALRANGLCLPVARTDVPAISGDVVRVSLANTVKFVADLQQREEAMSPHLRAPPRKSEYRAERWADKELEEAGEKGIDNVYATWIAVRSVKARRMGETFEELASYSFDRDWK